MGSACAEESSPRTADERAKHGKIRAGEYYEAIGSQEAHSPSTNERIAQQQSLLSRSPIAPPLPASPQQPFEVAADKAVAAAHGEATFDFGQSRSDHHSIRADDVMALCFDLLKTDFAF